MPTTRASTVAPDGNRELAGLVLKLQRVDRPLAPALQLEDRDLVADRDHLALDPVADREPRPPAAPPLRALRLRQHGGKVFLGSLLFAGRSSPGL